MEILGALKSKQKKAILLAVILSLLAVIVGMIHDLGVRNIDVSEFVRPEAYEGSRGVSFDINIEGGDESEEISYTGEIGAIKLKENEIMTYINSALDIAEKNLFRENENKDNVKTGINMYRQVDKNPVKISFDTREEDIFLENGNINFKNVKNIRTVELILKATYDGKSAERKHILTVYPKNITGLEKTMEELPEKLNKIFESDESTVVKLPEKIDEYKIKPFVKGDKITGKILLMVVFTIIGLFVVFNENNKKEIKRREEELKDVYTDFIGRFVILLGAGLSISAIWKKLEKSFSANKSLSDEIGITLGEIRNGKTEREAYENFGRRIGGTQYTKFSSILTQSLKMGSSQILVRLEAESTEAMFERRNNAKVKGEVADTKLLMPMMLQLVLIMLIIMVPALTAV